MTNDKGKGALLVFADEIRLYWKAYGGMQAIIRSPYLWGAFVVAVAVYNFAKVDWCWAEVATAVLPNMLGFTLGGYAIMLAFGDRRFQDAVRGPEPDGTPSPYLQISANLLHYVLSQVVALIAALLCKALSCSGLVSFMGCLAFFYSIFLSVAAALSIFFLSRMYDILPPKNDDKI